MHSGMMDPGLRAIETDSDGVGVGRVQLVACCEGEVYFSDGTEMDEGDEFELSSDTAPGIAAAMITAAAVIRVFLVEVFIFLRLGPPVPGFAELDISRLSRQ